MQSRHAEEVAALKQSVLGGPGMTEPALRMAAFSGKDVPDDWAKYVAKVRDQSYKVTDKDVTELKVKGYTEDAIFEVTIAASLGAAWERLDAGLKSLQQGA